MRNSTAVRLLSLLLVVAGAGFVSAQEPPAGGFREEIVVRVIDVDVVVTDRQGRPITDLKREDFELLESGRPVDIRYFSRIVAGQLAGVPSPAERTTSAVAIVTDAAEQPSAATAIRTPLTWVVFLDQTNISARYRDQTMRQLRTFLERAMAEGDRGLVASNDGLAFRIREGVTGEKARVLSAVEKLQNEKSYPGMAAIRASRIRNEIRAVTGKAPDPNTESRFISSEDREFLYQGAWIGAEIATIIDEEAKRTHNAIQTLSALIDALALIEGRVAVVYVGAGFNTLPGIALTDSWRVLFHTLVGTPGAPNPESYQSRLEQEVAQLHAKLSSGRVTMYNVYAADSSMPGADDAGMDSPRSAQRAELIEASLAREMASRTGGLSFKANVKLADQMEAVRNDLNNYYSLGYVPAGEPGKTRGVKVRVKREGARVRHREAVRERTPSEEAARAAIAATVAPPPARPVATRVSRSAAPAAPVAAEKTTINPLGVAVAADRPRRADTGTDRLLPFRLALDLETLTFRARGAILRAEFVVRFAVSAPDGTVWPIDSREHSLEMPMSESPEALGQNVTYSWNVDLGPLRLPKQIPVNRDGMHLLVTVEDHASRVQSVVKVPIPNG